MKCPACPQVTLMMSDRQGIEIDYCPECRGVWLDRGELDKLIERSAPKAATTKYCATDRDHDDYKKERYYKKKKSFLSEIFD